MLVRAPELIAKHPEIVAPAQQFAFAPDVAGSTAVREGAPLASIALRFGAPSTPSWTFDAGLGALPAIAGRCAPTWTPWARQLSAANVIVLRVPIGNDGGRPEDAS